MTTLTRNQVAAGMTVRVSPSVARDASERNDTWRIVKVMPKNIRVQSLETGKILIGNPACFELVDQTPEERNASYMRVLEQLEEVSRFVLGQVVTVRGVTASKWKYEPEQRFVVVRVSDDRVNVAKLGGDGGQYWRLSASKLVPQDV